MQEGGTLLEQNNRSYYGYGSPDDPQSQPEGEIGINPPPETPPKNEDDAKNEDDGKTTLDTGTPVTDVGSEVEKRAGATKLPEGTKYTAIDQEVQTNELLTTPEKLSDSPISLTADQVPTEDLEVSVPQTKAAAKYEAQTIEGTPEAVAAKGKLSDEAIIGDIVGSVSEDAVAKAAQGEVSKESTVKYQIGELFKSFEEGKPPPAWASPAIRAVSAVMQSRGMGSSSMASAAITQSIIEAGIPIAKADADRYGNMDMANLNNRQAAVLQNALTYAAMDRANLDVKTQVAVQNAKSFLAIDLQNLTAEQKMAEIDYAGQLEVLTSNQAAENAASQFNAQSQNQIDEFFASLGAQIESTNKNRIAAQNQFNVNESNATKEFVASLNSAREQFDVQMATQIDQSNAIWRREVNTANTANQNAENQINAANLLNMTQSAMNALWQRYRDEAGWAFKIAEDAEQRYHEIGLLGMEISGNADLYDKSTSSTMQTELGKAILDGIYNVVWGPRT